jgi:hypothetical protein
MPQIIRHGSIAAIAELLDQTNEILMDAVMIEGNLPTGHRTTVRADIPTATWRRLNYGVKPTKSHTAQVTDTIGMLETYAEIDKDLANLNGNTAEFRLSEDQPHLEGLNQQMASTNTLTVSGTKPAANNYGEHVIDAAGTGSDLTSIWLIVWGPNTIHKIYPKGSKAGLLHEDLGEQTLFDDDGGRFQGYRTHYQWKCGLCVRDWRYVVRIANQETTPAATLDYKLLIKAINLIPNVGLGRAAFYMNRAVKTQLDIAAAEKSNAHLTIDTVFGRPQTSFWGIPCRQTDAILRTESQIT